LPAAEWLAVKNTLGGEFLTNIHFNLSKVTLPDSVQKAVDDAQAAYAKISEARRTRMPTRSARRATTPARPAPRSTS
jgi:hypothetical protein